MRRLPLHPGQLQPAVGQEHALDRVQRLARPGQALQDARTRTAAAAAAAGRGSPRRRRPAILRHQPVLRQPRDADQRAEDGRQHDADHRDLQRVQHADHQRAQIGVGRVVGDQASRRSAARPRGRGSRSRSRSAATSRLCTVLRPEPPDDAADDADDQHLLDDAADPLVATRTGASGRLRRRAPDQADRRGRRRTSFGIGASAVASVPRGRCRNVRPRGRDRARTPGRPAAVRRQRNGGAYCSPPLGPERVGPRGMPIGARLRSKISP